MGKGIITKEFCKSIGEECWHLECYFDDIYCEIDAINYCSKLEILKEWLREDNWFEIIDLNSDNIIYWICPYCYKRIYKWEKE